MGKFAEVCAESPYNMKAENTFDRHVYLEFEAIFFSTKDKLFFFILKYVRKKMQAEDILQQCYIKLWEHMDEVSDKENALPLLFTYAKNLIVDFSRKEARQQLYIADISKTSSEEYTDNELEVKEYTSLIRKAINKLPEISKQIFVLNRENGLSYNQIAKTMNLPASTVRYHMSKTLSFLKKELGNHPNIYLYLLILEQLIQKQ